MEFLLLRLAVFVFPLFLTVRTVKVGQCRKMVLVAVDNLDVKFFSLVTFHITNHHHGWGGEAKRGWRELKSQKRALLCSHWLRNHTVSSRHRTDGQCCMLRGCIAAELYSSPPINLKLCTFFNLGRMNLPRISDTSISKSWICISLMWTSRSTSYLVLSASTHFS